MAKFPSPLCLKKSNQDRVILDFGKSEEVSKKDAKEGISRFGGLMRKPSYSQAYLKAAKIVRDKAVDAQELDELGLPLFYLLRHSVELEIKDILGITYEILDMTRELYPDRQTTDELPSEKERKKIMYGHKLDALYKELKINCKSLKVVVPEKYFSDVIDLILRHEKEDPTWSRYSTLNQVSHVSEEIVLPIIQLTANVEKLFGVLSYDQPDDSESLESELYSMYSSLFARLEE